MIRLSHTSLELRPAVLNDIKVGRVGRVLEALVADKFSGLVCGLPVVCGRIVLQPDAILMHLDHLTVAFRKGSQNNTCVGLGVEP